MANRNAPHHCTSQCRAHRSGRFLRHDLRTQREQTCILAEPLQRPESRSRSLDHAVQKGTSSPTLYGETVGYSFRLESKRHLRQHRGLCPSAELEHCHSNLRLCRGVEQLHEEARKDQVLSKIEGEAEPYPKVHVDPCALMRRPIWEREPDGI